MENTAHKTAKKQRKFFCGESNLTNHCFSSSGKGMMLFPWICIVAVLSLGQITRVVNGGPVVPGMYPDIKFSARMVIADFSLDFSNPANMQFCSAFIVSPRHIMTAGHCFRASDVGIGIFPNRTGVQVGLSSSNPVVAYGKSVWFHPSWNASVLPKADRIDLAVVELNQSIPLGASTIANFAPPGQSFSGANFLVSGWGRISDSSNTFASVLQFTTLPYVDRTTCLTSIPSNGYLGRYETCCGGRRKSKKKCFVL
jgi:secreted trypsin-like serine protease